MFSRVHATLYVSMSVRPSVGPSVRPSVRNHFSFFGRLELKGEQISVTALAQLPYYAVVYTVLF